MAQYLKQNYSGARYKAAHEADKFGFWIQRQLIKLGIECLVVNPVPDSKDGQYTLQNHAQLIKTLTEQEYYHYKAYEVRGFSGHWIPFYGIAIAVLFPFDEQIKKDLKLSG